MADDEVEFDSRFGKAIARGAMIGMPIALIGLTLAILLMTDNDLGDSFATAVLPGILLGVFGGGFVGMASTSEH